MDDARLDASAANKGQDQCTKYRLQEDVRNQIRLALTVKPKWTDRRIAKWVGTTHPTVAPIRKELVACGKIYHTDTREDTTGRMQPVRRGEISHVSPKGNAGAELAPEQPAPTRAREVAEWQDGGASGIDVNPFLDASAVIGHTMGCTLQVVKEALEDGERWLKRIDKDVLRTFHHNAFRAECEKLGVTAEWEDDTIGFRGDVHILRAKFAEVELILQALRNTVASGGGIGRMAS